MNTTILDASSGKLYYLKWYDHIDIYWQIPPPVYDLNEYVMIYTIKCDKGRQLYYMYNSVMYSLPLFLCLRLTQ